MDKFMDEEELHMLGFERVVEGNFDYYIWSCKEKIVIYKALGDGLYEYHRSNGWKEEEWE